MKKRREKKTVISVRGCWCGYWDNVLSRHSSSRVVVVRSIRGPPCEVLLVVVGVGAGPSAVDGGVSLSLSSLSLSSGPRRPRPVVILFLFPAVLFPFIVVAGWSWSCHWSWMFRHRPFLLADVLVYFVRPLSSPFLSSCHRSLPLLSPPSFCSLSLLPPSTLRAVARGGGWVFCGGDGVAVHGLVVSASSCHHNTVRSPRLM
jgi:hypothetical protein